MIDTQELSALLFKADPMGIDFGDNFDEYDAEAESILPQLTTGMTVSEIESIVHMEFVRWFDSRTAGPASNYTAIAEQIASRL